MGATGWSYFVPYEADVSAALQRLRQDVFARGDYVFGVGLSEEQIEASMARARPGFEAGAKELLAQADDPNQPEHLREAFREFAKELIEMGNYKAGAASRRAKRKPKTIDKLLKVQAESGTHSILDILSVSPEPQFGTVSPFPRSKLVEYFGSETPSHDDIDEAHDAGSLEEFVSERWQGIYIIVYRDASPSEIFFAGCSGD
jgi:hypothetical protein